MSTKINYLLSFILLFILISITNAAHAAPPTNLEGSWACEVGGSPASLVSFNLGGTLTASLATNSTSTNHGVWLRTGLNSFISKDRAFIFGSGGAADFIQITDAGITMPDNNNLSATLAITVTDLSGTVVNTDSVLTSCTRIQI